MPDPISSRNINDSANACIDGDGEASSAAASPATASPAASAPAAPASAPSVVSTAVSAVKGFVSRFTPTVEFKANVKSEGPVPGASSYKISQTALSVKVTSGPLKGTGVDIGNVSVTAGKDFDMQLNLLRKTQSATVGGYQRSSVGEILTARVNLGHQNDDGSRGGNVGAGVTVVGQEEAVSSPANSASIGTSKGLSGSLSYGKRDNDHDGKPEYCGKLSLPFLPTVSACIERPW